MRFHRPPRPSESWRPWALALLVVALLFALHVNARAETGLASWYGREMSRGATAKPARTASGAPWRPLGLSVAHLSLPMGTRLRVSFRGRAAICPVTDRGPAARTHRVLDLSQGCARAIGLERAGVGRVQFQRLD